MEIAFVLTCTGSVATPRITHAIFQTDLVKGE